MINTDSSINDINNEFKDLIRRIQDCAAQLSNLDLLRIQLVYTYSGQESYETETPLPINEFIATAWSKLSVYHAVFFKLLPNTYIPWTIGSEVVNIKSGDYLIKMPDNNSIYIPGNEPYVYQPTGYNNGVLSFTLTIASAATTVTETNVPQWCQGSNVGRVWKWAADAETEAITQAEFTVTNVSNPTQAILSGRYFVWGGEEIKCTPTISETDDSIQVTWPRSIAAYYIPYYIQ